MTAKQKNANQQASSPQEENLLPMELDIRIRPVNKGNILAYASMNINKAFAIDGIKVLNGEKGIFVSMPSYKGGDGKYHDICFPINKVFREQMNGAVLGEYRQTLQQMQEAAQQYNASEPEAGMEMSM